MWSTYLALTRLESSESSMGASMGATVGLDTVTAEYVPVHHPDSLADGSPGPLPPGPQAPAMCMGSLSSNFCHGMSVWYSYSLAQEPLRHIRFVRCRCLMAKFKNSG